MISSSRILRSCFALFFFGLLIVPAVHAQEFASSMELEYELTHSLPSPPQDSLKPIHRHPLLPSNISILESTVWGEDGLLRSTGIAPPLTPDERRAELQLRRTMLSIHQIGGFVTLGLMASTVYYGQLVYNGDRQYLRTHKTLVAATILSYTTTGLLALLSPPPYIRRDEVSTITVHKWFAWLHITGMIVTPIVGGMLRHSMNYNQLAKLHLISGYVTLGALTGAMVSVTF